jgi:alpha-1,3-glucosyltransferase
MRFTVLLADLLIFIPSIYLVIFELYKNFNFQIKYETLLIFLISPPLILIDNGHFQYNNIRF